MSKDKRFDWKQHYKEKKRTNSKHYPSVKGKSHITEQLKLEYPHLDKRFIDSIYDSIMQEMYDLVMNGFVLRVGELGTIRKRVENRSATLRRLERLTFKPSLSVNRIFRAEYSKYVTLQPLKDEYEFRTGKKWATDK